MIFLRVVVARDFAYGFAHDFANDFARFLHSFDSLRCGRGCALWPDVSAEQPSRRSAEERALWPDRRSVSLDGAAQPVSVQAVACLCNSAVFCVGTDWSMHGLTCGHGRS